MTEYSKSVMRCPNCREAYDTAMIHECVVDGVARRIIPITLAEYIHAIEVGSIESSELSEIEQIRNALLESGAMDSPTSTTTDEIMDLIDSNPWNGPKPEWPLPTVMLTGEFAHPRIVHNCVTPDYLWERMAPSLELRDDDGEIPTYSEFESYAIIRSHEEFPGCDSDNGMYCDHCDCLRMIWLRYQLTAALDAFGQLEIEQYETDSIRSLRTAIRYELEIAIDNGTYVHKAIHPAGKDSI